ncbi:MAG: ArsR family transcriptional regulator [Bacteroidaceae bacterium]|nr:ArsR family transcriptional regulator [Bacteroidaceae bacterium]
MKKIIIEVSEQEEELLAAIRNYNKSFPDGSPELLWYAQRCFDNILRQPYE